LFFVHWDVLTSGNFVSWCISPDHKYLYYIDAGADPQIARIRLSDRKSEIVASLKDQRILTDWREGVNLALAPDGSPLITRDIGTQEIYALDVKWP
jgi:hypothetical protein